MGFKGAGPIQVEVGSVDARCYFACAVAGMATLFTACVRAPLTGIVLTVETTGRGNLPVALLRGSLAAMVVTMPLSSQQIYETLKRRMIEHPSAVERSALPRRSGIEQPR